MSARARRRRAQRWASEAAQQAIVRYGPEEAGLQAMAQQAKTDYSQGLRIASGTTAGIIAAAGNARRGVGKIYDQAGLTQAKTAQTFEGDTANLGPVADSIKAGVSLEQATGLRHLTQAKAADLADLSTRVVAAREGGAWAKTKARQDFIQAIGQVLSRQQSLAREKGAFTASTMGQLMQADLDRRQQLDIANAKLSQQDRNSLRSAGIDPDTGKPFKNGPLDPNSPLNRQRDRSNRGSGGKGGSGRFDATAAQIGTAQDNYQSLSSWARKLADQGLSREDVQTALLNGRKAAPVYRTVTNPKTGVSHQERVIDPKTGVQKTRAEIPAAKSALLLQAALDMTYMGHLSAATAKRLRNRGIHPKQIGDVILQSEWERAQRRAHRRNHSPRRRPAAGTGNQPGPNGQLRPG